MEQKIDYLSLYDQSTFFNKNPKNAKKNKKKEKKVIDCVKSGFLEKQSLHLKKLRKRWVILTFDGHLCCYKTAHKNDGKATEKIDLKLFGTVRQYNDNKASYQFEIISLDGKTKRLFIANNTNAMNNWIKMIKHTIKNNIIKLPIIIQGHCKFTIKLPMIKHCKFAIYCIYSKQQKMKDIMAEIKDYIHTKYYPLRLKIINMKGFIGMNRILDTYITDYARNDISQLGLTVITELNYEKQIISTVLTCKHMNKLNSNNALHCPIYYAMKEEHQYNNEYLNHLCEYIHFKDEYLEKPVCKYKDECKSYLGLQNGNNGSSINDQCHMKLYLHPPRLRNIKLAQNLHCLVVNKSIKENHGLYAPIAKDHSMYNYNSDSNDGYLNALIEEVINNGYKYDLCVECGINDDCKHNNYSILKIVNDKMNHKRHKAVGSPLRRDQMLSLVLYTGCECNYDLCKSQRNGDYNKWKWFDYCLWNAICKLSNRESGLFDVWSGLSGVKLNKKEIKCGYFVSYVSSSWRYEVAKGFMNNNNGMIVKIDKQFKNDQDISCCDVSWISLFPDECEILFARSLQFETDQFKCIVLDNDINNVQTVLLNSMDNKLKIEARNRFLRAQYPDNDIQAMLDEQKSMLDEIEDKMESVVEKLAK